MRVRARIQTRTDLPFHRLTKQSAMQPHKEKKTAGAIMADGTRPTAESASVDIGTFGEGAEGRKGGNEGTDQGHVERSRGYREDEDGDELRAVWND